MILRAIYGAQWSKKHTQKLSTDMMYSLVLNLDNIT